MSSNPKPVKWGYPGATPRALTPLRSSPMVTLRSLKSDFRAHVSRSGYMDPEDVDSCIDDFVEVVEDWVRTHPLVCED